MSSSHNLVVYKLSLTSIWFRLSVSLGRGLAGGQAKMSDLLFVFVLFCLSIFPIRGCCSSWEPTVEIYRLIFMSYSGVIYHKVGQWDWSCVCKWKCTGVRPCDVWQNVSFQCTSSFATGIVLQRFAITALRRLTKGGQFPHMWRQWFYFSRMFGIVFLPAQSGKDCPVDSRSSWQRNSWLNGRRLMENRHWMLILLFSFPLLTGTGIDRQTLKYTKTNTGIIKKPPFTVPVCPSFFLNPIPSCFLYLLSQHCPRHHTPPHPACSHTQRNRLGHTLRLLQLVKQILALPVHKLNEKHHIFSSVQIYIIFKLHSLLVGRAHCLIWILLTLWHGMLESGEPVMIKCVF